MARFLILLPGAFNETLLRKGGKEGPLTRGRYCFIILQRNPPQERRERSIESSRTVRTRQPFNETLLRKGGKGTPSETRLNGRSARGFARGALFGTSKNSKKLT